MLNNTLYSKLKKSSILLVVASIIFYFVFAYYTTRTEYYKIVALYAALFFLFYKLVDYNKTNLKLLTYTAVILRLIFIFSTPNLSQDFYRFIWDGRMIFEGFNPYLYTPDSFINNGIFPIKQAQELYNGMGELSSSHYTNYPPINQLCFTIAALFSSHGILGSIISMRLIIIAADIGTLYFGKKLLERLKLPSNRIFWYILNPFIIIELTGNLHFEGVMVFFLIWAFYLLYSDKWKWAAVIFACSISVKLIPLMLLPLFFKFFRTTKTSQICYPKLITFYAIIGITILLLFLPFFSMEFVNNYSKTVGLWFGNFEFNASIYYLLRAIGYSITGYNEIAIIGKILPIISVFIIFGFSLFKQNNSLPKLITSMLLVFTCYLFLSTTVHPWYIATLVIFCVFTNYKFPLVWSFVIILSYLAYSNTSNTENLWIIGLEYLIVFSVFIWEVVLKKRLSVS
ncbi:MULTISPECIES: mannosyltransferase [Winogradskyella]|uniref:mannosyltransferase n=1 Tax=Winogradskyella TaxID=286104 RepID=UPI0015C89B41|nr:MULTISPECIES: mannosyltransferase [Winogradskyella]QXP77579.1 mannosyltransferase [Winogradskyella sp. HaHa_3_26]